MPEPGGGPGSWAWDLPRRPWWLRTLWRTGQLVSLSVAVLGGVDMVLVEGPAPPLTKRVGKLRRGETVVFLAHVLGDARWCPRLPDQVAVAVTMGTAVYTQGRERAIPIHDLTPTAIHRPRSKRGITRVPRRSWVLDVVGAAGAASIAADVEDLALLAAIARWSAPPGLGSVLHRPRVARRRPRRARSAGAGRGG